MRRAETGASPWTPLRHGVFRALWLASVVSSIGTWMQTVGAQWLLVQHSGPVVVTNTYTVTPVNEPAFLHAMARVRLSRLRTGAAQWGLFRDGETAHRFVEVFVVPSWEEHLRQHRERLTGADRQYEEQAETLSETPPRTAHLLAVDADLWA